MRHALVCTLAIACCIIAVYAQAVTGPLLTLPSRVAPGASITIQFSATISSLPSGIQVVAAFAGDSERWGNADLPQVSKVGNVYTFRKTLSAPKQVGVFSMSWNLKRLDFNTVFGAAIAGTVEVTCSDGIYCNGVERYVGGRCQNSPVMPCRDPAGDLCATYDCIEATQACGRTPVGGPACLTCVPDACKPSCKGVTCGGDGCGGSCGSCTGGLTCVSGSCQQVTLLGSCSNPEPLFASVGGTAVVPDTGIIVDIFGDNRQGIDIAQPVCNVAGIPEYVYKIVVNTNMGFEIRMTGADGSNGLDSVLAVHDANCQPIVLSAADRLCSDDQTPPGNLASRVDGLLPPGTYTVIATAYATSTLGAFKLAVKFTPNCVPKCEGKFCGNDGCGGTCGACGEGTQCFSGRCQAVPCTPNCHSRQCGSDGCGGLCGVCKNKHTCDLQEGQCIPVKACNNFVPVCQGTGSQNTFCGTDCQWHKTAEAMPDLIPNGKDEVLASTYFQWQDFPETSCALAEGCVTGSGARLLMRFDTRVHNIGTADFIGPNIGRRPDLFTWASCHQHYHFDNFARFGLYNNAGGLILPGGKLSYCMEDAELYQTGSHTPCTPQFDCLNQGIPRGRTDNYPATLDCQWLDITDLPTSQKGCWVQYEVCTNIGRTIFEMSYDNNCVRFPVYIPRTVSATQSLSYADAVAQENAMSFYPGCKP
eukprot:TRINITY_DN5145_c0_g2_i1.p1 TRINITY_DN5145_c0_g2~~TRINITY_DN5145_c0_g2_i1.p1  ORF type:complete len:701 (+),score=80.97 TRINITY_DN5145_c0_g2_i1:74-2176(+)